MARRIRLALVLLALALLAGRADAQHPPDVAARNAAEAISQLKSPFGPHMLDICPNEQAEELRNQIRAAASGGSTPDELVDQVLARYGKEYLVVPRAEGIGLWAWLLPPAMLLIGAVFVQGRIRRMRGQGSALSVAGAPPMSDDERAQLNAAMREFEREDDEP
jgi:cytochrome c-type biogenesis protein CcmH